MSKTIEGAEITLVGYIFWCIPFHPLNFIIMNTTINNIPVYNMGVNNYSHGMELLVFNPKDITVEDIKAIPNVFLNPTAKPNSIEIFALKGTQEQFDSLLYQQKITWVCQKAAQRLNSYDFDYKTVPEWNEFQPWYEK